MLGFFRLVLNEDCVLLGCGVASIGNRIPTFPGSVLSLSSRIGLLLGPIDS
jgi:hypothetical protein